MFVTIFKLSWKVEFMYVYIHCYYGHMCMVYMHICACYGMDIEAVLRFRTMC